MKRKQIMFTSPGVAQIWQTPLPEVGTGDVLVRMEYTVVSGGTEKACLLGSPNVQGTFPTSLGYCGIGRVLSVGDAVRKVRPGDRVLVYHGCHSDYNVRGEEEIIRVDDDGIDSRDAAFVLIAAMGLGGVRKLEIEIGESAMVIGLGLLGMFSVQFCRLCGAYPVIAVDFSEERRKLALSLGADHALDPRDADFKEKVMALTGGKGVRTTVEVTGSSAALGEALDTAAFMGRIALLGCTRVSDFPVDFYTQVHRPGIRLIGAHNFVRPKSESYPGHWTNEDDCRAILSLIAAGRISVRPICSRFVKPALAPEIYRELATDPDFPIGTVFDWREE